MIEINITNFLAQECMRDYSASVMEIGTNAGADTWRASVENAPDWNFLETPELIEEFKSFVIESGGWDEEEVSLMTDCHLQALCLQWIAGDARDCGADVSNPDWLAIRADQECGRVNSSIGPGDNGQIYWCPM